KLRVARAVLLHRGAKPFERRTKGAIQSSDHLAPCARLRCGYGDWNTKFAQGAAGLGSTGSNLDAPQSFEKKLLIVAGRNDLREAAHAHAGEKDHQIEVAMEQPAGKFERLVIRFNRDFAHRGRN